MPRRSTGAVKITSSLQGGDMAYQPAWQRKAVAQTAPQRRGSISCMLFLAAMGAAFWAGAIWASQVWLGW
jgi:hypothetical protein